MIIFYSVNKLTKVVKMSKQLYCTLYSRDPKYIGNYISLSQYILITRIGRNQLILEMDNIRSDFLKYIVFKSTTVSVC